MWARSRETEKKKEENPLLLQWQSHFPSENKEDLYMKTSKRLLALLLVLAMAMSTLAACGKTEEKKEETKRWHQRTTGSSLT